MINRKGSLNCLYGLDLPLAVRLFSLFSEEPVLSISKDSKKNVVKRLGR